MILISHDRDFLDRVVSSVIVPEGADAGPNMPAGYSDMLRQRGADIASTKPVHNATAREQKAAAAAAASKSKKKLNFNDKHALENLARADRQARR